MRPSKLAAGSLALLAAASFSASSFAEEGLFHGMYINAEANSGRAKNDGAKVDTFGVGAGIGAYIKNDFFIQVDASQNVLDDGDDSDATIAKALAGIEIPHSDGFSSYVAAGGYYLSSSDYDSSSSGLALSAGFTYGSPRYRFLFHYDYLEGGSDELISNASLFGIGLRIQLGGERSYRGSSHSDQDSLSKTTACKAEHKDLFSVCDNK